MLAGVIVTVFVTRVVLAVSDARTVEGCVLRASVVSGDANRRRSAMTTAAYALLRSEWSTIHTFSWVKAPLEPAVVAIRSRDVINDAI
ncbi:MAG: hypothetical protein WCE82_12030 [Halobacteriota archaeon]